MRKIIVLLLLPFSLAAQQADIIIKNGKILDGTGNSWTYGDIAVKGVKIIAIGKLAKWTATKTIDATGLWLRPVLLMYTPILKAKKKDNLPQIILFTMALPLWLPVIAADQT